MASEIVSVPFHGDSIQAARTEDGRVVVVIKRICDSLGIDFPTQLRKLKGCHWAGVGIIPTADARGAVQELSVVDLESLPLWLVTINPGKVAGPIRRKLELYQLEAKEVLARHFLGDGATTPAKPTLLDQARMMVRVLERQEEQERRLTEAESRASTAIAVAESADAKATAALVSTRGDTGYVTLLGFCKLHGIRLAGPELARVGQSLRKLCDAEGIAVESAFSEVYGRVNTYPVEVLERWHEARTAAARN